MLTPSQIILIVTAGIIFLFGAFIGFKIGDARLHAFEAVIKIQTQAQEARTKKVEAESTKQTQEINDAYQAGITSLNQYYTKRLRDATIAQRLPAEDTNETGIVKYPLAFVGFAVIFHV